MSAFLHEIEKFFLITCNSVYSELTFDLSVLFHACHVYRGLEPLKTVPAYHLSHFRERSGSVVECLTRDRRAAGSSLTGVTALWSLSKTHLS